MPSSHSFMRTVLVLALSNSWCAERLIGCVSHKPQLLGLFFTNARCAATLFRRATSIPTVVTMLPHMWLSPSPIGFLILVWAVSLFQIHPYRQYNIHSGSMFSSCPLSHSGSAILSYELLSLFDLVPDDTPAPAREVSLPFSRMAFFATFHGHPVVPFRSSQNKPRNLKFCGCEHTDRSTLFRYSHRFCDLTP